jgi:hypothetical protein
MKPIALLTLAGVVIAAAATAASIAHKDGSESWTAPSGSAGSRHETVLARSQNHALRGLKLWDYDRRACALEVEQSSLDAPSRGPAGMVRVCQPQSSQSWQAADVGDGRYITAIEVCTMDGDGAAAGIRGLKLWGSTLDGTRVEKASAELKVELFGCKKWRGKVACPEHSVATGLRARYNDAHSGIVGLELRCHELVSKE